MCLPIYVVVKQPWKAEELPQTMREAGVMPQQNNSMCPVAEAWRAVGLKDEANRILDSLYDHHETSETQVTDAKPMDSLEGLHQGQALGASYFHLLQVLSALSARGQAAGTRGSRMGLQDAELVSDSLRAAIKSSDPQLFAGSNARCSLGCMESFSIHARWSS